jgi:basic membrane protein A
MKKFVALALALVMAMSLFACSSNDSATSDAGTTSSTEPVASQAAEASSEPVETVDIRVAMITDYGDITDESFNQTTYEACKEFSSANNLQFNYYKPASDTTADRVGMVEAAIADGYNVVVMPGYAFGETITTVADIYPDVYFVALDVSQSDLGDDYTLPSNVFCAVYQEELAGYMAGYAAVKLGYTKLGFLGGMAVPAVVRYGYGFVQGADDAAAELGITDQVSVEYAYGNQFWGDADITAAMDNWYGNKNVEVVFACGGGIYSSAAEAAQKVGAKVIGVDVDQAATIDKYAEGMTVTSAMKGLAATVKAVLTDILAGNWADYSGKVETLGLVSGTDPEANYVQLPSSTQWADGFQESDYVELVGKLFSGEIVVSNDTENAPEVSIAFTDNGNIK